MNKKDLSKEFIKEQINTIRSGIGSYLVPLQNAGVIDFAEVAEKCRAYDKQLMYLSEMGVEDPYSDIKSSASILSYAYGTARKLDTPGTRQALLNRFGGVLGKLYRFLHPQVSYLGRKKNITKWIVPKEA